MICDEFESEKGPHGHYGEEGYKYITEWPVDKRIYMVENYFNFIFVRHPLERLLSAYRDKVPLPKQTTEFLSKIKVQYEFLRNLPFPGRSHKVEEHHAEHLIDLDKEGFHAFLKYLVRRADIDQGGSRIRHWKRFVDLCGICSFKWDFIGKLETVNQDRFVANII